jgi:hypothetical protein
MPPRAVYLSTGSPQLPIVRVDGADVVLPEDAAWRRIEEAPGAYLDGWPVDVRDLLAALRWFVRAHRGAFALALYRPGPWGEWLPLVLLRRAPGWQRVHIEHVRCARCGWWGATANPTVSDLYLGVPNQTAVLAAAWALAPAPCPACHAPLPRRAIWAERAPPDAS